MGGKNGLAAQQYLVMCLENCNRAKLCDSLSGKKRYTKHVSIMDASNIGLTTLGTVKALAQNSISEIQDMYPETLKKLYIVNTGWLFRAAWKIICMWIDSRTAAKISI